jgi:hypothetical protein
VSTAENFTSEIDYEEPADATLRAHLGLRPIVYNEHDCTADPRPCPSWCWIGQSNGEYEHEIEPSHPMSATHTLEASPSIVASQYVGDSVRGEDPRLVTPATIEPRLEQVGQGEPIVHVALRHGYGKQHTYEDDRLLLSLDDARELVTVLNHLIETADKG